MSIKNDGVKLFAPEKGGSYTVFLERPLKVALEAYAAVDVFYFEQLKRTLFDGLSEHRKSQVMSISEKRLVECLNKNYQPKGRHKAIAPTIF
jgi:exonuclease 3'-5' domain-containing protein 1